MKSKKRKYIFLTVICILILWIVIGGTAPSTRQTTIGSSSTSNILKKPPTLTVICSENSTQALLGTYSWHHRNLDGTFTGTESDSMHPLQAKEYMQPLNMIPSYLSHIDPLQAYLQFDVAPDSVEVYCWSEEYWDQPDADSSFETLTVTKKDADSAQDNFSTAYTFQLKEGNFIYMITAKWNSSEDYLSHFLNPYYLLYF